MATKKEKEIRDRSKRNTLKPQSVVDIDVFKKNKEQALYEHTLNVRAHHLKRYGDQICDVLNTALTYEHLSDHEIAVFLSILVSDLIERMSAAGASMSEVEKIKSLVFDEIFSR